MADRRAHWMMYPLTAHGEGRVVNHLCAPGLGPAVRRYISETYEVEPVKVERSRRGLFDPGGAMLNANDKPLKIQLRGWHIYVMPSKVPDACWAIEERLKRPPRMYGKLETFRWNQMYGMLVLTREDTEMLLEGLKPHVGRETLRRDASLEQLASCRHVHIPGRPRPAAEA